MATEEPPVLVAASSSASQTPFEQHLPPPFANIPGISNLRSISFLPIHSSSSSQMLRGDIIYRGPDLGALQPASLSELHALNITTIFDLRSPGQIARQGGLKPVPGIHRIPCQIFTESQSSPEKSAARYLQYSAEGTKGIVSAFEEILDSAGPAIKTILHHISELRPDEKQEAFLVACTTGNNRTGCLMAIILSLLGVCDSDVCDEYALSTVGLASKKKEVAKRLVKNAPAVFGIDVGEEPDEEVMKAALARAERVAMARRESMVAMLEMVDAKWGGAKGYAKTVIGVDPDEAEGLVARCRDVMSLKASE